MALESLFCFNDMACLECKVHVCVTATLLIALIPGFIGHI